MAKYDDFGRPIYETAEEYNKARKAGTLHQTYDSPEGAAYKHNTMKETYRNQSAAKRHATVSGSKKAKKMITGVAIFLVILNIGIIFVMFNAIGVFNDDIYQEFEEDWVDLDDDEGYGEYLGDDATPLPEGFDSFLYNGQLYTLPTTFAEIDKMGFFLEEDYDKDYMLPTEYEDTLFLFDEDGFSHAMVHVSNYTDVEIPLGKSKVDYFYIENPAAFDDTEETPDFVFGNGLSLESSYEELEAYFGVPYYHYEDHSEEGCYYDSYEWVYYGEDENHRVTVTFWNDVISDVGIQKSMIEE